MNDKLFLLSTEEFKKYEDVIPRVRAWWWLRSHGYLSYCAACVNNYGSVNNYGYFVRSVDSAVRPALKIKNPESLNLKVGDRITAYNFPFIVIDVEEGLAIAEVPIAFRRFDEASNNYEKSEVRKFLMDWVDQRSTDENFYQCEVNK